MTPPPPEVIALNRLAFGPRPGDVEALAKLGLGAWLDQQLQPDDSLDAECVARVHNAKLHIEYPAGKDEHGSWSAVKEDRRLTTLDAPIQQIWHLADYNKPVGYPERMRPLYEVRAATWIRAVYSRYQLREVMADFWHNHFNVNAIDTDAAISVGFPSYDRDVIRKHCFGNFRQLLEAVATSVPMLRYLNNSTSRASPANENFARELFELHGLGAENYLNALYNRWQEVPKAADGRPTGYIDQDVYEAARAFTGWTLAGGQWARDNETLPNTGAFVYYDGWHDPYQKRVLGVDFHPYQPPMADGRKVLDLVAEHPGTARHVCTKLCRRLVSDHPDDDLLAAAIDTWNNHRTADDQIAQVIRTIVLHPSFAATHGGKVRRPFEFTVALLRATGAEFAPDENLSWWMDQTGQRLFGFPTPNGHPDDAAHWLGANVMLARWNLPVAITQGWFKGASVRLLRQTPDDVVTGRQLCEFWTRRILGYLPDRPTLDRLTAYACADAPGPDQPLPGSDAQLASRVDGLVALVAMTPEFQMR